MKFPPSPLPLPLLAVPSYSPAAAAAGGVVAPLLLLLLPVPSPLPAAAAAAVACDVAPVLCWAVPSRVSVLGRERPVKGERAGSKPGVAAMAYAYKNRTSMEVNVGETCVVEFRHRKFPDGGEAWQWQYNGQPATRAEQLPADTNNSAYIESINQSKGKCSYATRSLKTKQHTTPDELESHNPMPANHMATPLTGEPQAT